MVGDPHARPPTPRVGGSGRKGKWEFPGSAPEPLPRWLGSHTLARDLCETIRSDQGTNLVSTDTVGDVTLELPGISPDAEGSKVSVKELEPVMPPQATIWPVMEGELA